MPFDVAFSLPDDEAMAWGIICGTLDGGDWDFDRMEWKKPK